MLSKAGKIVFLLDVDNTLLDNDRFSADLDARLGDAFGEAEQKRYRRIERRLRDQVGYADYLGALQEFRGEVDDDKQDELLAMSGFLLDYPFKERIYPSVPAVIEHLSRIGTPVILSDGDIVFQPRKVQGSGLHDLLEGRVLITLHKEKAVESTQRHFPAGHYVMVDDKLHLLTAMKAQMGDRLTTLFVRQGHYAENADVRSIAAIDYVIDSIGELASLDLGQLLHASNPEKFAAVGFASAATRQEVS